MLGRSSLDNLSRFHSIMFTKQSEKKGDRGGDVRQNARGSPGSPKGRRFRKSTALRKLPEKRELASDVHRVGLVVGDIPFVKREGLMTTVLQLDVPRAGDREIEAGATLAAGGRTHRLWWRFPPEWKTARTAWADPFVVGMLFLMMEAGDEVRIEGSVSPSLLENLERYMAIWRAWDPKRYTLVRMRADHEAEAPAPGTNDVLTTFSGGVDSCYTLARHLDQAAGRRN